MRFETDRPYAWATTESAKRERAMAALGAIMLDVDLSNTKPDTIACLFVTLATQAVTHDRVAFHVRKIQRLIESGLARLEPDMLIEAVDKAMELLFELVDTNAQPFPYLWDSADPWVATLADGHYQPKKVRIEYHDL